MKQVIYIVIIAFMLFLNGCSSQSVAVAEPAIEEVSLFSEMTLEEFYKDLGYKIIELNPEIVDFFGDLSFYDVSIEKNRLNDITEESAESMKILLTEALAFMEGKDEGLDFDEKMNYLNIKWYIEMELERISFFKNILFLGHFDGEHLYLNDLLTEMHIVENIKDAEYLIERYELSGKKINDMATRYTSNTEEGYVMDPHSIKKTIVQISGMFYDEADRMAIYRKFEKDIETLALEEDVSEELLESARIAINDNYIPAMKNLVSALNDSLEVSRVTRGVWQVPDGDEYYQHTLKYYTTTDYTPEEIHELGLKEVERIVKELEDMSEELGYNGSVNNMITEMKAKDKRYKSQLTIDRFQSVMDIAYESLPDYFHEEDIPKSNTLLKYSYGGNYYMGPSMDGKREGAYFLDSRFIKRDIDINPIAFHEGVPGHHLQRTKEVELVNIPLVSKFSVNTAFTEGWALYAEMLADEMGLYDTPSREVGYLKSELLRAARLVADTGIHSKQWSRGYAIDYLTFYAMQSEGLATSEVTRYTSWPGQACAYKIGQLKILELRDLAEESLGDLYDIKDFHSAVLKNGSMPLELLELQINQYIEETLNQD
ncbi:MAG: DUF885 domain-containing protein [Clostridiales bacterium]|nr:DUF885 domain-containing protein [Clostridiales bacterium]